MFFGQPHAFLYSGLNGALSKRMRPPHSERPPMTPPDDSGKKPSFQHRSAMTRKGDGEGDEPEGKPTLSKRGTGSKMPTRQERIVQALNNLDDDKLRLLTTRIGPDELAVAINEADQELKSRIAGCYQGDQLQMFNEYLAMPKSRFPGDVVDGVQGKLLRLAL
jgi:hypothetical protein